MIQLPFPRALARLLPAVAAAWSCAAAAAPLYHLSVLEAPGAGTVQGLDINDAGQIAGRYLDQDFNSVAAYWDADGSVHALALPGAGDGIAYAINNHGRVVGTFADYEHPVAGLLWDAAAPDQATRLGEADVNVAPNDISDADVVVGGFGLPAQERAFVWSAATGLVDYGVQDPDVPFQQARWLAVNASGKLVGSWNQHSSTIHATVGQVGTAAVLGMGGSSDAFASAAVAVNAAGTAVGLGLAVDAPSLVPVIFDAQGDYAEIPGATLGEDSGCAAGINDAGVVVGSAGIGTASGCAPGMKAWVYRDGAVHDLYEAVDDPGPFASFQIARAVNAAGVIVGQGRTAAGDVATFVLTPLAGDAIFADGFEGAAP
jgi:uncharacterized membrane protein